MQYTVVAAETLSLCQFFILFKIVQYTVTAAETLGSSGIPLGKWTWTDGQSRQLIYFLFFIIQHTQSGQQKHSVRQESHLENGLGLTDKVDNLFFLFFFIIQHTQSWQQKHSVRRETHLENGLGLTDNLFYFIFIIQHTESRQQKHSVRQESHLENRLGLTDNEDNCELCNTQSHSNRSI